MMFGRALVRWLAQVPSCDQCGRPLAEHYERCVAETPAERQRVRLVAYVVLGAWILGLFIQAETLAKWELRLTEGYAIEDAAKKAGKKLECGIYGPCRVVNE